MNRQLFLMAGAVLIAFSALLAAGDCRAAYELTNSFTHPDPTALNQLRSVAMSDDYLLVSATANSGDPAQVLVFDVTGTQLIHTIDDPTPGTNGFGGLFGKTAIGGNHIAIAEFSGASLSSNGRVHLYDANSGLLQFTLASPMPSHATFAGGALAVNDEYLVVGAYGVSFGINQPSFPAKIFVFDASSGGLLHTLEPPAEVNPFDWGDRFALFGSTIAVGTPGDPDVDILFYDAQTGLPSGTLENPMVNGFDYISFQDDKILLGENIGDTFLLDTEGNLLHQLPFPDSDPDISGSLLDFSGNNILIGSFGSLSSGDLVTPTAWLYDGASGELLQQFDDANPSDRFVSMASNPSGSHIAFLRLFDREVMVYSRVPEPSVGLLTGLALFAAMFCRSRRNSH